MFRGTVKVKQDSKGRIVIPTRYRDALSESQAKNLVITGHPYGFLLLMFKDRYEVLEKKVNGKPDSDNLSIYYKQTFIGMAEDISALDKACRISVSSQLREHAEIKSYVSLVGMGDHIRIWGQEKLEGFNGSLPKPENGKVMVPEGWDGFTV